MLSAQLLLAAAVGLVLGGIVTFFMLRRRERVRRELEKSEARDEASRILKRASDEADTALRAGELAGREEGFRVREAWEKEETRRREDLERAERRNEERSVGLDRQVDQLKARELELGERLASLDDRHAEVTRRDAAVKEAGRSARVRLEQLAGLSAEEAKKELIESLEDEARADAANTLREVKEQAQREAEREARKIVALSIQRMAADLTAQTTVSVVQLPSDEMKGRIIGREGRNIRAFEQATGVDVVIDDTPEAVVLSAFDPVRREIARMALAELVEDGRIHPGRIEETVEKAGKEVERTMFEAAEEVLYELGIQLARLGQRLRRDPPAERKPALIRRVGRRLRFWRLPRVGRWRPRLRRLDRPRRPGRGEAGARAMPEHRRREADRPSGASTIAERRGTAPGLS